MRLEAATVLLQWAVGGLAFLGVTTRRRVVGPGYGWLLRGVWGTMAGAALAVGLGTGPVAVREVAAAGVVAATAVALAVSVARRHAPAPAPLGAGGEASEEPASRPFPPGLDLVAPAIGVVGLVAAGADAGGPTALAVARVLVGAAFLGAVSDAMLLGHWYLVQPGLSRAPLLELVRLSALVWVPEVIVLVWPTGMVSVLTGAVDDGWSGVLGWFWVACAVTTIALIGVTRAALRERQYSAVMAATGLLYLAILTAAGTDLVARAVLAP